MEAYTLNQNPTYTEEDIEWALAELERERKEIRDKVENGEYIVYEGKIYNSYGNCIGMCEI